MHVKADTVAHVLRQALRRSVLATRASRAVRGLGLPRQEWFEDHYPEWRQKRIEAIRSHYGPAFFRDKSLLEVGCGFGDIGASFVELGADVTCSDGRADHVAEVGRRHPNVHTAVADLDKPWAFPGRFDVLIHMGVLYHLANPEQAMRSALDSADHVVLETEVLDSADPHGVHSVVEVGYDQAVNYRGGRPSAAMLERIITEAGRTFARINDGRCNSGVHTYDWPLRDTGLYTPGQRRLWFISPPAR